MDKKGTNKKKRITGISHKGAIIGKPLIPNAGIRAWYTKELNELVSKMEERTRRDILRIWEEVQKKGGTLESQERIIMNELKRLYQQKFEEKAKQLATSMVKKQNRSVSAALNDSIKSFAIGSAVAAINPVKPSRLTGVVLKDVKASILNNVSLIKSIQSQYHSKVEEAVYRAIIQGEGVDVLKSELLKYGAESKRRARNIAKDQSHKAYEALSRSRMEQAGIKYWQWKVGAGVKEHRKYHAMDYTQGGLNNSIHRMGDKAFDPTPSIQRGIVPGELPFCSCRTAPVFKFEE